MKFGLSRQRWVRGKDVTNVAINEHTMTANSESLTLGLDYARYQKIDTDTFTGTKLVLPPAKSVTGHYITVYNEGSTNDLLVRNHADDTTLATLTSTDQVTLVSNGTAFVPMKIV